MTDAPECHYAGHVNLFAEKLPADFERDLRAQCLSSRRAVRALHATEHGAWTLGPAAGMCGVDQSDATIRLQQRGITLAEFAIPAENKMLDAAHLARRTTGLYQVAKLELEGIPGTRVAFFSDYGTCTPLPLEKSAEYDQYEAEYDAAVDNLVAAIQRFQRAHHANPFARLVPDPHAFENRCQAMKRARLEREKRRGF